MEKQDYILMKQKEKMAAQDQQIESKEAELHAITVHIKDTEAFVEEVSEVAYEKAVEAVSRTVQEEVRNEDFEIIAAQRNEVLNDSRLKEKGRQFAGKIFTNPDGPVQGNDQAHLSQLWPQSSVLPKEERIQEPIRRSISELLARNKVEASLNKQPNEEAEQDQARKKRHVQVNFTFCLFKKIENFYFKKYAYFVYFLNLPALTDYSVSLTKWKIPTE